MAAFGAVLLALVAVFWTPLNDLVRFALSSDLYSHIVLIPLVSVFLVGIHRHEPQATPESSFLAALVAGAMGLVAFGAYWLALGQGWQPSRNDSLSITTFAFVAFVVGGLLLCFGRAVIRQHAFAVGFLILAVPWPETLMHAITVFFQHASAEAAASILALTGTPMLRNGLTFELPGIVLEVAEECSGIRSSLVLFISSLLAGHLFLRRGWKRAVFAAAIVPIGILRNALRIVTIALLCVHSGPHMVDSIIHRRGGPAFFALSLVPFFLLLWWLKKSEPKANHVKVGDSKT